MLQIIMAVALVAVLLSACGGGGGGDGPSAGSSATFSGTVAIGEPLAGTTVLVLHASGIGTFATTDAGGRYSATLSGLPAGARPLFMIQTTDPVSGVLSAPVQYPRLYSISNRASGTVNLTPLTSLQVARLLGERQGFSADLALLQSLPTPSDGDIAAARQQVVDYLLLRPNRNDATLPPTPVDASLVADFIRTPFNAVAGDPHDNAIESLGQTFMEGETIEGVEEHMLARSDPPATLLEILSLEADVNCVAAGNPNPGLPVGRVHVSLRQTGEIIFRGNNATYSYTLVPGDGVSHSNAPFFDSFWRFDFRGRGTDHVIIFDSGRRLGSIQLNISGPAVANCTPVVNVPLGARTPRVLAQVRRLASAISNPSFNCLAGASFPGINDGVNTFAIQSNGALRVTAGHTLHLPSLGLVLSADIVDNAGALGALVRTAGFSRSFADGFDSFGLNLDTNGMITRAQFARRRGSVTESRSCPS
jgi:hypothetical protein